MTNKNETLLIDNGIGISITFLMNGISLQSGDIAFCNNNSSWLFGHVL